ncbi:hypothetical protein R1flu_006043 [Riccia fluitans]|uniref:Uncharacterized protein n=1 Tax=Riccia fluitans TaxID=41844 RepID=A0ABD1YUX6_9MARC
MSKQSEALLADIGKRLTPSQAKDSLLKLLKQAAVLLQEVEQSPPASTVAAMKAITEALVLPSLLRHKDKDVKLLVASCISEIMRIVAPEAPYEDDVLKDIFQLIVNIFQGLNEVSSPSFPRRVNILETVAKVRSCVVMLDLECDDLILEMFHVFFNTASEEHPQNVFSAMRNILALVLEESEEVSQPLLEAVLANLLKSNKSVSPAAHKLAVAVVERCAEKLEPYVQKFLTSVMLEGKGLESELREDYHNIIYEIYRCAPQMLLAVIPNLTRELVTDQIDVRLKAVELLGRLFALPGQHVAQEYKQLFSEFLKRFSDKAVEVRLAVVACAKACLEANPSGPEASDILAGLNDRLLDYDDKVRMSVVTSLCDLVSTSPKWVPKDMIKRVAERLRDKKVPVRKDTLQKLAQVYRTYTTKCKEGSWTMDEQFEWIPSKIVRCAYDKDFRPQGIEIVFTDELFSADLPVEERAKHWIAMMSSFDKIDEKAFRNILGQKLRLQVEMQNYLTMRQKSKEEDSPELQKKIQACFKALGGSFVDATKAEENFQKLHQMKDNSIFKSLNTLLNPSTAFSQAQAIRDELLKRIGEKHPQHDFIKTLATKCSFLLFTKEHVKAVLKEVSAHKLAGNKEPIASSLSLLVEFAGFFPALLEGTESDLLELLKESDESIKEGVVHILAKAGGSIRDQIAEKESAVDLTLEQLCLEGSRKQAKHAVSAIAAISADSGLKALSVLYGRLVDLLDDKPHLPTILQSLGCIAENAMPVFETREDEVVRFVIRNVLKREVVQEEGWKPDSENPSEECLLKICGLKVLIKSFLPIKDAHLRTSKLKGLLPVVFKLLTIGEVSEDIKSSDIDKANLRLAAGKAILRLSRRWDQQITPNIVQGTLLLAHDPSIQVRQKFLLKVHQYLKDRSLPQKYACVFALVAVDPSKEIVTDGKRFLAEFVETCRREARSRHVSPSGQIEGTTITFHPEYVLTYLIHALAHETQIGGDTATDISQYETIYRQLLAYLRALVHQDGDSRSDPGKKDDVDNLPAILAIFRNVKSAEDLVDKEKSETLYTICDIGILITKDLVKKKHYSGEYPGSIPLPASLYRVVEASEGEEAPQPKVDGSHLPACLTDKDVLARFRSTIGASRTGQPASPRGQKRERRSLDEESSSDEGEKHDETEFQPKKPKHSEAVDGEVKHEDDDVENASHANSKPGRGRKKSNGESHKNGPTKIPSKQKKEVEEAAPKRKRGRPAKNTPVKPTVTEDMVEHSDDTGPSSTKEEEPVEKAKGKKQVVEKPSSAKKDNQDLQKTLPEIFKKKPVRGLKVGPEELSKDDGEEGNKISVESVRSPAVTPRKASQRSSATAAEKTPSSKMDLDRQGDELIGCKIRVWWPLDKRYYKGTITHYDSKKKKHRVIYDDNEVENLNLANEKYEIVDTSKAVPKKVTPEKSSVTPSASNQSGKLKRKASGQSVDNGSQSPGPSDKKRATTPKGGKESSSYTLQGVGRGLAQAKSGSLSTPVAKSAKKSAFISAGPFGFSDDDLDEPASDKAVGKPLKSPPPTASKGVTSIKIKRKAESELEKEIVESEEIKLPRDKAGKEKLKDKPDSKKDKVDKAKETVYADASKGKVASEKSKEKAENEKSKAKAGSEKEKPKGKVEAEKKEKNKSKVETEKEEKAKTGEAEKSKSKAETEKERKGKTGEAEKEKAKPEKNSESEKSEAGEAEKGKAKPEKNSELEKTEAKSKAEVEKPEEFGKTEMEKAQESEKEMEMKPELEESEAELKAELEMAAELERSEAKLKAELEKVEREKAKLKAALEKSEKKFRAEQEKAKAKAEAEKMKAKAEAEQKAKAKAEVEKTKTKPEADKHKDTTDAKSKLEVEKPKGQFDVEKPKMKLDDEKSKGKAEPDPAKEESEGAKTGAVEGDENKIVVEKEKSKETAQGDGSKVSDETQGPPEKNVTETPSEKEDELLKKLPAKSGEGEGERVDADKVENQAE